MFVSQYDKEEVRSRLVSDIRSVCEHLLPAGRQKGSEWRVGSLQNDKGESLAVSLQSGQWYDHATSEKGDVLALWMAARGVDFTTALDEAGRWISAPSRSTWTPQRLQPRKLEIPQVNSFDWSACVDALTDDLLQDIAEERGLSVDFALWLRDQGLIGAHDGKVAFPVIDANGNATRCHFRSGKNEKGKWIWKYEPIGEESVPWVIGNPFEERETWIFESQWDAFAIADRLGYHEGKCDAALYITRGATNASAIQPLKDRIPESARLVAFKQNDPEEKKDKNGQTPADKWMSLIEANCNGATLLTAKTPEQFKDANDWTKAGATVEDLQLCIQKAKAAGVMDFATGIDLLRMETKEDPNCLLGDRWLCKGGSCLWIGNAGIGKSTLAMQFAIYWAMGLAPFGIQPKRQLKSLFIQAENDDGDMSEMLKGVIDDLKQRLPHEGLATALNSNLVFIREVERTGAAFCAAAEKQIAFHKPDLVWLDPLLSYAGDDIMQQKVASDFLRNKLNPISTKHGIIWMVMHHTGKPQKDDGNPLTASQLQYLGLGSSELQNWARAVNVILPHGDDAFTLTLSKRGKRAGAMDLDGEKTRSIHLQHSETGLAWVQIHEPEPQDDEPKGSRFEQRYDLEKAAACLSVIAGMPYSKAVKAIREGTGMSEPTAKRTLKKLKSDGKAEMRADNLYYRVSRR